jgi:hypothetical protein
MSAGRWSGWLLLCAAFAARVHAAFVPDPVYAANFEAAPDCTSIGATGCPGFSVSVGFNVAGGGALSQCYYFRTGTGSTLGVGRFASRWGPAVANSVVYTTADTTTKLPADRQPPGTLSSTDCTPSNFNNTSARRIYSAHEAVEQLRMPDDDGAAQALALDLPANAAGFIDMYVLNASEDSVDTFVQLTANGREVGQSYTKTATYVTYAGDLSIPPFGSSTVTHACAVPGSAKFWWFSTQTYNRATSATLRNGATTLLTTSDWQHPAIATYAAPSFYQCGAGEKLTYECSYMNNLAQTVQAGDSYQFDENCVGIGYYFPGDGAFCFNDVGPL